MSTQYRYKIIGWGKEPITRVEMVSESAQFITYIEVWCGRPQQRKEKKATFFSTFEEARAELEAKFRREAEGYRQRMNSSLSRAGDAKALKNPYLETA